MIEQTALTSVARILAYALAKLLELELPENQNTQPYQ
jgi:hypothetical protein